MRLQEHHLIHQHVYGWELDGKTYASAPLEVNELTGLGERLLKLVADRESPEAESAPAPPSQ